MELSRPFIKLPLMFCADSLAQEVSRMPDSAWMPHPSGLEGNSAVALISRSGGDNNDFSGVMSPTPHLLHAPYHRQVMASFNEVLPTTIAAHMATISYREGRTVKWDAENRKII